MKCEEIRSDLPLYTDDVLNNEKRQAIESHLPSCPLCRQRLADYTQIRMCLGRLESPPLPKDLEFQLHSAAKAGTTSATGFGSLLDNRRFTERISHWLMPLGAGAIGSVAFAVLFLSVLLVRPGIGFVENPKAVKDGPAFAPTPLTLVRNGGSEDYVKIEIPENSPEINPAGALIALTRSIVRGEMTDKEVVVVADVFGNGIANIAEVVEPPGDEKAMRELRRAFETTPENAPFLPARMSGRSDAVRVVLRIQRVDVNE